MLGCNLSFPLITECVASLVYMIQNMHRETCVVAMNVSERGGLKRLGLVTQRKRSENSSVCGERKTKKAEN